MAGVGNVGGAAGTALATAGRAAPSAPAAAPASGAFPAARLGDPVGSHNSAGLGAFLGGLAGFAIGALGVAVAAGAIVLTAGMATPFVAAAYIGVAAAGVGAVASTAAGTSAGAKAGQSFKGSPCSRISSGSHNVFIEGKKAVRATVDTVAHGSPPPKVKTGCATIFVNAKPAGRESEKSDCGGAIVSACARRTFFGGPSSGGGAAGAQEGDGIISVADSIAKWAGFGAIGLALLAVGAPLAAGAAGVGAAAAGLGMLGVGFGLGQGGEHLGAAAGKWIDNQGTATPGRWENILGFAGGSAAGVFNPAKAGAVIGKTGPTGKRAPVSELFNVSDAKVGARYLSNRQPAAEHQIAGRGPNDRGQTIGGDAKLAAAAMRPAKPVEPRPVKTHEEDYSSAARTAADRSDAAAANASPQRAAQLKEAAAEMRARAAVMDKHGVVNKDLVAAHRAEAEAAACPSCKGGGGGGAGRSNSAITPAQLRAQAKTRVAELDALPVLTPNQLREFVGLKARLHPEDVAPKHEPARAVKDADGLTPAQRTTFEQRKATLEALSKRSSEDPMGAARDAEGLVGDMGLPIRRSKEVDISSTGSINRKAAEMRKNDPSLSEEASIRAAAEAHDAKGMYGFDPKSNSVVLPKEFTIGDRAPDLSNPAERVLAQKHARATIEEATHALNYNTREGGAFVPLHDNVRQFSDFVDTPQGASWLKERGLQIDTRNGIPEKMPHEIDIMELHQRNSAFSQAEIERYDIRKAFQQWKNENAASADAAATPKIAMDRDTAAVLAEHGMTQDSVVYRVMDEKHLDPHAMTVEGNPNSIARIADTSSQVPNPRRMMIDQALKDGELTPAQHALMTADHPLTSPKEVTAKRIGPGLNVAGQDPGSAYGVKPGQRVIAIKVGDILERGGRIYRDVSSNGGGQLKALYATFDGAVPFKFAEAAPTCTTCSGGAASASATAVAASSGGLGPRPNVAPLGSGQQARVMKVTTDAGEKAVKHLRRTQLPEQMKQRMEVEEFRKGGYISAQERAAIAAEHKLTDAELHQVADVMVAKHNAVADALPEGMVPPLKRVPDAKGRALVEQEVLDVSKYKQYDDLGPVEKARADEHMLELQKRADRAIGSDGPGSPARENGIASYADPNRNNFYFDEGGNVALWPDPAAVMPNRLAADPALGASLGNAAPSPFASTQPLHSTNAPLEFTLEPIVKPPPAAPTAPSWGLVPMDPKP